jgi:hypothetical protein
MPDVFIGVIDDVKHAIAFARMIQPAYQRQQWKWIAGGFKRVPTVADIAETIELLARGVADGEAFASTGGLTVRRGNRLYVSPVLKPDKLVFRQRAQRLLANGETTS